jgi:hypothetical protein
LFKRQHVALDLGVGFQLFIELTCTVAVEKIGNVPVFLRLAYG